MKAVEALYQYDTLTRLNDSGFGDSSRNVGNMRTTSRWAKSGGPLSSDKKRAAHRQGRQGGHVDFRDDLLDVLDQMSFDIIEIDKTIRAAPAHYHYHLQRKKDLSDLLGRCVFPHHRIPRSR